MLSETPCLHLQDLERRAASRSGRTLRESAAVIVLRKRRLVAKGLAWPRGAGGEAGAEPQPEVRPSTERQAVL